MSLLEHLEELRGVLIHSGLAVILLAVGGWFVSERAVDLLIRPAGKLVFLGPAEAFTLRLKTALLIGLFAALPFVLYKVWGFVAPGLFTRERRVLTGLAFSSTVLFFLGALFGFFVLVPIAFAFLLGFGTENLTPMISAGNYFGFVSKLVIAFGVVFQLPLVVSLLTWAGVVEPRGLLRSWRLAVVVIAVASAALTPPDVASQILMGVPVLALYFLSVLLSAAIHRRRRREDEEGEREEEKEKEKEGGTP
ncbi:MAG: twin-arginine translocase subunit TatC [Candidatus Eisenbacteria bacterium]|nr:twin-arginine translocase subunit TatC [Candidatus Eisenbacteria bacterium]